MMATKVQCPPSMPATKDDDPPASAFATPAESLRKHPLQSSWTLWYLNVQKGKEWEECLKEVTTFATVEDWWSLYNHIVEPSRLQHNSDYYLFKTNIKPMWEDDNNVDGGRWVCMLNRNDREHTLDRYWLELVLALIGEQFGSVGDIVCGAAVNLRGKGDKISLWTRDASRDVENVKIGEAMKRKLSIRQQIKYELHRDSQSKVSSNGVKPKLVV